jgi:rhodanese-related sulfurtransferase
MSPFPLPLEALLGKAGMYLVYLAIGFAFGYVLEISGFAISTKLAAQFYFKDLTVLKVMFTAIVVAMVLIFGASALGLLDYNLIWVNPTYIWSGILGGLIMGFGFIIGGFCPGTSLVSMATFKIDGLFFALGGLFGIFLFGETVQYFEDFWNGSYLGRFTLMDWLGLPAGIVVLLVILMALIMFWGGEQLEHLFGGRDLKKEPRRRYAGAAALVLVAILVLVIGQPTSAEKWSRLAPTKELALAARDVQIHPGELLATRADDAINLVMLDVRSEADYNQFHIRGARHLPQEQVEAVIPELLLEPAENTVYVLMSNDETAATDTWKTMVAQSVPNVYILEGGINRWLETFNAGDPQITPTPVPPGNDLLGYTFPAALGDRYSAADPSPHEWELEYTPKIQLQQKRGPSGGGCG